MKKHLKNVVGLLASMILGLLMLSWGMQQIDLMVSPLIQQYALDWTWWFPFKGWFGFSMRVPDAYIYMLYMIFAGWLITLIGVFAALWWWSE